MHNPLLISLQDDSEIIINEEQVCAVFEHNNGWARVRMSNGDEYICKSPDYEQWFNDLHKRKD